MFIANIWVLCSVMVFTPEIHRLIILGCPAKLDTSVAWRSQASKSGLVKAKCSAEREVGTVNN